MLYKGRKVTYIRDAVSNDPYFTPDYEQVIVEYNDGEGRETVKKSELDGWNEKTKGGVSDVEKAQNKAIEDARKVNEQPTQTQVVQPVPVQLTDGSPQVQTVKSNSKK